MFWMRCCLPLATLAALLTLGSAAPPAVPPAAGPAERWCAPELSAVTETVCFHAAKQLDEDASRTLVLFLHSLVGDGSSFAWEQQRLMLRNAEAYGFSALIPRGRPGLGPGRDRAVLAWPTARELQEQFEDELIAEWQTARQKVESQTGPFDRVLVFGFSNGAYYATSLALRGRLDVDGYGVFAGGNGGKYHQLLAEQAKRRVPLFVGYGTKDPDHRRQQSLVRLLRTLGWPHRSRADRIGHTVSDSQIRGALAFLGHDRTAGSTSPESSSEVER